MFLATDCRSVIGDDLVGLLEEAWRPARDSGVVGSASIRTLYQHARGFVLNSWLDLSSGSFIDCGSGAGVLGILLALELPSSRWTLVDSSERRCELAQMAVASVGLRERVLVEHATVESLAREPGIREHQDGVVARLFGPVTELAECGLPLLRRDGSLVVSVSDRTLDQWTRMDLLAITGCEVSDVWSVGSSQYLAVTRVAAAPQELPRRRAARRRTPLDELTLR